MRLRGVIFWGLLALVLAPAVALTVIRIVDPESALTIQAQAFTPFAIPVYAATLVLLVAAAVVRSGSRVLLLAPALVSGLVLHSWWFAPQVIGDSPAIRAGAEPLTVMTANLYFGRGDAVALVKQASERQVDVLVVNEITERGLSDMNRVGVQQLFPHQAGAPGESIEGTMVFSRQEIAVVSTLETPLASLAIETGGVTMLAVHPSPPTQAALWVEDHRTVLAAAQELDPDVIAGDFNATADHAPMRALADAGFRDTAELANKIFQPTWPANGEYPLLGLLPPTAPIDHVLVSDEYAVVETGTTSLDGTAHRPVVAEIAARD